MRVPYMGNSAYCFTHSLHMCLTHAKMPNVPSVGMLECMTGMPFGATFLQQELPTFFPSPSGTNPDEGLTRALKAVGWTCDVCRFQDRDQAYAALRDALSRGPVLLGPLDMGFLTYDPNHAFKRGADHFVVALRVEGELLQVHDPQSFPFALLPIADFERAWNARGIGYSAAAYTFRSDFRVERIVSEGEMLAQTLDTAREVIGSATRGPVIGTGAPGPVIGSVARGPVVYGGSEAFARVASLLRDDPPDEFIGMLLHFALPLGARRSLDAAGFFEAAGISEAARLSLAKAEGYGRAQFFAVRHDWQATAEVFDGLSSIEAQMAHEIGNH